MKSILQFFSHGFALILGMLFMFGMGLLYAFLRPEELLINVIFFVIGVGWLIFTIKMLWDLLEKRS